MAVSFFNTNKFAKPQVLSATELSIAACPKQVPARTKKG